MLTVSVSKNVEDYQENIIGTLNAKKTLNLAAGIGLSMSACLVLVKVFALNMDAAFYISSPLLIFFVIRGMYDKDGMDFDTAMRRRRAETYRGANYYQASGNDCVDFMRLEKEALMERHQEETNLDGKNIPGTPAGTEEAGRRPAQMREQYKIFGLIVLAICSLAAAAAAAVYLLQ